MNTSVFDDFICDAADGNIDSDAYTKQFQFFLENVIKSDFKMARPNCRSNFPKNKWFDEECKSLKKLIREQSRFMESEQLAGLQREYKQLIQRKKRDYFHKIAIKLEELHSNKPQMYWKFWKKFKRPDHNNGFIDANAFAKYYESLDKEITDKQYRNDFIRTIECLMESNGTINKPPVDGPLNDVLNAPIIKNEVLSAIKRLKNNKAAGIDNIPAEFFKFSNGVLLEPIVLLFNKVFDTGNYPRAWCEGIINPVHKQGSKFQPENFRKITIVSALGKLFEIIMNNRLTFVEHALHMNDPFQNGFKENSRATDNAFILNALIDKSAASKRPLYICYVDFKAAFDKINRAALLYKMMSKGIGGKFIEIIKSMFSNAKSRVKWNAKLGTQLSNLHGVLQGGVLSPTLFNLFVTDLGEYLDAGNGISVGDIIILYLLFADDLLLVSPTSTGLQSLIRGLEFFCKQWEIEVNLVKTKCTVFNRKYVLEQDVKRFVYNDSTVEETDEYKYVGTTFSNKRQRFHTDMITKIDKAKKAIYAARKMAREAVGNQLPLDLYFKIFDTQIRPILDFGCEVWSNGVAQPAIEKVHTDFIKQTLGLKQQTPHLALYGETGRYPLVLKHQEMTLKYWLRLLTLDKQTPLYKIYMDLVRLDAQGHSTWCKGVKHILNSINLQYLWDVQGELTDKNDHARIIDDMRIRLRNNYKSFWQSEVQNAHKHPKLRTYALYKSDLYKEPYISEHMSIIHKKFICKYRVSSHRLGIETGRYINKPVEERLCVHCPGDHIDDEIHLLTECSFHSKEREALYQCVKQHMPDISDLQVNLDIFIKIMSCQTKEVLIALGRFLHSSFTKREI